MSSKLLTLFILAIVAAGVTSGRSKEEIAEAVGLDERTVGWHLERAGRKLERASALHKRVRGNKQ